MRLRTLNIAVPTFLALTSVAATVIAVTPDFADNWVINPLTGLTAIAFCFLAFARLSIGVPGRVTRNIWQGLIAVFCTVACGQFLEGYDEAIQQVFGIDDVANCVLLIVSPITLWMIGRFDPPPLFARGLFLLGFVVQSISTLLDVGNAILIAHWNHDVVLIDQITDFGQFISLQIYLGAVAVFLISLHLHQRTRGAGIHTVGDLSRYLFVRLRLVNRLRQSPLSIQIPGIEFCLWVFHLVAWVPIVGPEVRTAQGKSLRRQLLDIFQLGLGSGMDAQAYYVFELYREGALQTASAYLTLFEAQHGLFEALSDHVTRPPASLRASLQDRRAFHDFCRRHGLPSLPLLELSEDRQLVSLEDRLPQLSRDVVMTAQRTDRKAGSDQLYQHIGRGRYLGPGGRIYSAAQVYGRTQASKRMLLVPRLPTHPDLAPSLRGMTLRVRILTCLTLADDVAVTHARLTVAEETEAATGDRGDRAVAAPIDLAEGTIGAMSSRRDRPVAATAARLPAVAQQDPWSPRFALEGRALPFWEETLQLARDAHAACHDRVIVEWVIACTAAGPVLVSASESPDVERLQQVHRQSIGESPLGEHLAAYLRVLEDGIPAPAAG